MSDTGLNWIKLVNENRAKAIGIPWTDEELNAIYNKGVSPDDVRNGILEKEKEEAKKEEPKKENPKPIHYWKKDELIEKAKELGLSFDETIVQRSDLVAEINKILNKKNVKK